MKYLFDVNTLIALGHANHSHHQRMVHWYLAYAKTAHGFYTCSISELGFLRVAVATGLQSDIKTAGLALEALKASSKVRFELLPDDLGAAQLPSFVKTPKAVTDGHLVELAKRHGVKLLTLDTGIPGAQLV